MLVFTSICLSPFRSHRAVLASCSVMLRSALASSAADGAEAAEAEAAEVSALLLMPDVSVQQLRRFHRRLFGLDDGGDEAEAREATLVLLRVRPILYFSIQIVDADVDEVLRALAIDLTASGSQRQQHRTPPRVLRRAKQQQRRARRVDSAKANQTKSIEADETRIATERKRDVEEAPPSGFSSRPRRAAARPKRFADEDDNEEDGDDDYLKVRITSCIKSCNNSFFTTGPTAAADGRRIPPVRLPGVPDGPGAVLFSAGDAETLMS